jgi:phosphoglycolate phosphatase
VVRLPQCILFDLDGTLLDSIPGIEYSVRAAFAAADLDEYAFDLRQWIGPPIRTILSNVARTEDPVLLDALERAFRASYDAEGWRKTPCFPGVLEVLAAMKAAGHRLFIVSNKPRQVSCRILEMQGIATHFERIYTRDSIEPPYASKAGMLQALLADHRLGGQDCVMVGDTMEDASAAALHKIGFIFMEHGYGELTLEQPVLLRLGKFSEFMPYVAMENVRDR